MAEKPVLHYSQARDSLAGVCLVAPGCSGSRDGVLMFQQVPMVEMDRMKLVQTRAILNYLSNKYDLHGKDIKERALIDMYSEGLADLNEMYVVYPFNPPGGKEANIALIKEKAKTRYFPVFEKALKTQISNMPNLKNFLQLGSQRKPPVDEKMIQKVREIYKF